ncbi:MAG: UDP-3-O-(3-hydroxymyristoyl)glucosamine N-acyltransferase [Saprospiraceae bacterium]
MEITAAQLAQLLNGSLEGDPKAIVTRPARIEEALAGDFAFMDNPKYEHFAYTTEASVLLVHTSFKPNKPIQPTLIRVDDVRGSLAKLLQTFEERKHLNGSPAISEKANVHPSARVGIGTSIGTFAVVDKNARIGDGCVIYAQVYIGPNVRIGNNCKIFPGARIHADCVVGDNCILHANVVIGADGFGYAPQPEDNSWKKMPQVGNVVLENDVEVGACTCIDRAALGSTIIRQGAKLDNLIHIAHNAEVGRHTAIAAQAGIAGSTHIGDFCQIGGQVGVVGHVHIADGTRIQAQSGISAGVDQPNTALFGSPAIPYKDYIKAYAVFKQLPEMERRVRELERKLRDLGDDNAS